MNSYRKKSKCKGAEFTKQMKKTHTILLPDMLEYHNEFLKAAFEGAGYKFDVMTIDKELAKKHFLM